MSEYIADGAALTHTADRIRAKTGGTDLITWDAAKGFGDAVDAITGGGADDPRITMFTFTPTENTTSAELPFEKSLDMGFVIAYCANIQGTGDVSRIKQFYSMKLPLTSGYAGRIDVVNADGTADFWSNAHIDLSNGKIKLFVVNRECYFAAGETYTIQITEVTV